MAAIGAGRRPLAGRASEVLKLEQALVDARSGAVAAVVVLGEPGIGKTRLLGELCEQAATANFDVLTGHGTELERDSPFGVIIDALDEKFASLVSLIANDIGLDRLAELAAALPSLSAYARHPVSRSELERFGFHRAVRATLEQLVLRRPLVLALDDVHWADPASMELICFLTRHLVPGMVLALAYRPRQMSAHLLSAVAHAAEEGVLREFELSPLTIGEAAQALGVEPSSPIVRLLHAESGGNPFYLEQLARAGPRRPIADNIAATERGDAGIPIAVRTTITQELAGLAVDTINVLRAGAVAGDPFDVDLVAAITDSSQAQVLRSLDELVRVDVIRPAMTPGQFRFRHPIVRRVVYDDSMPGWRFAAHKRAARALTRRGASLGERAHHVEYSASPGDEEAAATLVDAARAVAPDAPATAVRWFEAALRLLPSTPGSRLPLLVMLARALANTGRLRDSRRTMEQVLELLPTDSVEERVGIIRMIAHVDHALGHAQETRHLIDAALDQAPAGSASAIALELELAQNQWMCGQWEQAVRTATRADFQAANLGDSALLVEAKSALAMFANDQGDFAHAKELVDWVADCVDTTVSIQTPELLEGMSNLVFAEIYLGLLPAAVRHAERGLEASRDVGQVHVFGLYHFAASMAKMFLGRLPEARHDAEATLEAALLLDNDPLRIWAEGVRCWVETTSGDLSAALAAGHAAVHTPHPYYGWFAHACYGQALVEAGEYERGRHELRSIARPGLSGMPPGASAIFLPSLVKAELAVGRIEEAEAVTRHLEETAQPLPFLSGAWCIRAGHAHYARACMQAARDDFSAAAASAHEAHKCFEAVGARVWAARARLDAGRALARTDDIPAAVRELELAHTVLSDIGAARLADDANKELRKLGKRIRRRPVTDAPTDPAALTERERDVAVRVTQGYTNHQIATELFISPKTVEKHLARIFTKLGISSRGGVAAAMNITNTAAAPRGPEHRDR